MRTANQLAQLAVNVRSEARSAYEAYRSNFDIAQHYRNNVLPLRSAIEQQSMLTYNGMITSTFELISDTRDKITSTILAVNAKRDFWLAEATLAPSSTAAALGRLTRRPHPRAAAEKETRMLSRRQILGAGAAGAALISSKSWSQTTNMGLPEAAVMESAATQKPSSLQLGRITIRWSPSTDGPCHSV